MAEINRLFEKRAIPLGGTLTQWHGQEDAINHYRELLEKEALNKLDIKPKLQLTLKISKLTWARILVCTDGCG